MTLMECSVSHSTTKSMLTCGYIDDVIRFLKGTNIKESQFSLILSRTLLLLGCNPAVSSAASSAKYSCCVIRGSAQMPLSIPGACGRVGHMCK